MKIGIVGGTGFVGSYIIDALLQAGHELRVLTRPGSEHKLNADPHCTPVPGDVANEQHLRDCLDGTEAALYLIGILRESPQQGITFDAMQRRGAERTIAIAEELGLSRFLLMSANGIDAAETPYQTTKLAAEERLKASSLQWTIFRPSVIFGPPRGRMEFCTQLKDELIDSPLPAPLFFSGLSPLDAGAFRLAPVHVEDVAAAFATALTRADASGQTYSLCGPDSPSWKEILKALASASGKSKLMLPAPALVLEPVAAVLGRFSWFPVTRDQLRMLLAGNTCSDDGLARLGIVGRAFDQSSLAYLATP
ncbi:NAD(P)H-binding protein [Halochromatium salexigens]|uniref:Epimerase n=1 Tax=Halochromatium salexigens TaxID=49447 RepID=A0AAJ0UFL8_HALSE|nr:NAD(P)H-binding protein [Halochromatium salexigens]MBK5929707.1 epimerase [Halochromatium salexigens]